MGTRGAAADIYEDVGHLYSWEGGEQGLQQGMISGNVIKACGGDFGTSAAAAVSRWNDALGRTVFQASCSSPQAYVTTDRFYDQSPFGCDGFGHGCTATTYENPPEQVLNGEELHNPMYVRMNPALFGPGKQWPDGHDHTSRDVTHEFGHVLGHADYDFGQYGQCQSDTIMDTWERCYPPIVTPQPLDETNYEDAYRPNAPTNVQGSSTAPGQVNLTWNPSNVHAEAEFRINRWPAGQGCCGTYAGQASKNESGVTLTGQPSGLQTYHIWAYTYALGYPYGDWVDDVTINVQGAGGVPGTPVINSVQILSSTSLRVNWSWGSPQGSYVQIERKTGTGGTYAIVGTDTASPFDDGSLSPGATYCYRMRAHYDSQHYSGYSNEQCGTLVPSPPASVSLSGANGSGTVSWSSVSGATSYRVHVGRNNGGNYTTLYDYVYDSASPFGFSYTVSDNYHGAVKACNASGCSGETPSNPFWVWLSAPPPAAPTNVTITQNYGSSYGVRLCWTDNSSNESKFQVRARAYWNSQTYTWDVNPNTTCFNAVFFADAWHFCVRSVGSGGESYGWVSVTRPTSTAVYWVNVPCSQTYCQNAGNTNNNPHSH